MTSGDKNAIISDLKNKFFPNSGKDEASPRSRGQTSKSTLQLLPTTDAASKLKPHHKRKDRTLTVSGTGGGGGGTGSGRNKTLHNQKYDSSPTKEPEPLCIFGCCGRGKLLIMWMEPGAEYRRGGSGSARYSSSNQTSENPLTNKHLSTGSANQTNNNSNSIVSSLSHHLLLDFGSSSQQEANSGSSPDNPPPSTPGNSKEKLGSIQFSLKYDYQASTLTLKIIKAVDLAAKDFSGTSDPYVKVMLLPDKKNKLTTNIKRRNLNPKWNEVFAFEGYPHNKLMSRTLYMQVLDYDRFSRDDPIGEVCLPLNDIDLSKEQNNWMTLQPCKSHMGKLGELLVTLCYQPTAETVSVGIVEARSLKAKDINGLSDPYVKIWMMRDGKKIEKRKTIIQEKCLNPIYNESFMFCIPYEFIRQTSLAIFVMDYDRMGRNEQIGQITLGSKSGPLEMKHWNEMFQKSRQTVSQWHVLKDFG